MRSFLLLIPVFLLLSACASYGDWVGRMEQDIAREDTQAALQVLEQHAGARGKDATLYHLNRGMLLRMQGDLVASGQDFEQAKTVIEALLAVSVSEQVGALAINDAQRSYVGEPFERAFLHVYAALNFLERGAADEARVEMLQLDVLLGELERGGDLAGTALPRYLAGMVFESRGEWSDAMIAYRKAYEAYHAHPLASGVAVPPVLGRDLMRLAARLGLAEELARYRGEFGEREEGATPRAGEAELIFLLHSGLAPVKQETGMVAPTPSGRLISVSMPYYQSRQPALTAAQVSAEGRVVRAELVEDIDAAARAALEKRSGAILARTVARAAVKHEASRQAGRENELAGLVLNIAGLISERADTRSWSTLPNRIYLARLAVPAGRHEARVDLIDRRGGIVETRTYPLDLLPGEKRFLSVHRVTPADLPPWIARPR